MQREFLGEMADFKSRAEDVYDAPEGSGHVWTQGNYQILITRIISKEPGSNFERLPRTKDRKLREKNNNSNGLKPIKSVYIHELLVTLKTMTTNSSNTGECW